MNFKNTKEGVQMKKGTRKEHVGETKVMNCGKKATITAYRGCLDMDVTFESGEVRTGISYGCFAEGSVLPIAITDALNQKIGEVRVMNNGMKAEIVACRTVKDIDVQFSDGTIKEHTTYSQFLSGKIANPNVNKRVGETRTMRNKMEATITAWRKHNDIDVTFSDGYVVYNTSVEKFERGTLENPNAQHTRVGETNVMRNGLKATITEYRNSGDMDVEFEDGSIRKNVSYAHFKEGKISLKSVEEKSKKYAADRIGERKLMNCGQWCEITEYFAAHDITVKFDSGTILKKKYYTDFSRGMIVDPNSQRQLTEKQQAVRKQNSIKKEERLKELQKEKELKSSERQKIKEKKVVERKRVAEEKQPQKEICVGDKNYSKQITGTKKKNIKDKTPEISKTTYEPRPIYKHFDD